MQRRRAVLFFFPFCNLRFRNLPRLALFLTRFSRYRRRVCIFARNAVTRTIFVVRHAQRGESLLLSRLGSDTTVSRTMNTVMVLGRRLLRLFLSEYLIVGKHLSGMCLDFIPERKQGSTCASTEHLLCVKTADDSHNQPRLFVLREGTFP